MLVAHMILTAAEQLWPPFVPVSGLILIGGVAGEEGSFEAVGARLATARIGPRGLLVALLGLVAFVTVVLNLDTAVVFLTPVLVHSARRRGLDERPFLYAQSSCRTPPRCSFQARTSPTCSCSTASTSAGPISRFGCCPPGSPPAC